MSFSPLRQLDTRLEAATHRGAELVHLGRSAEGRALVAVRVPRAGAPRVLVVAGMHAPELLGPLAALAVVERALSGELPPADLVLVPCIDRDGVAANLAEPFDPALPVGLPHHTDYEALLPTRSEPVGAALWPWLLSLGPIDAMFSLHSAAHVAPGAFVYASGHADLVRRWVMAVQAAAGPGFPWAATDPTGTSDRPLASGFFAFPASAATLTGGLASALRPRLVVVPELPPAVARSLAGASLAEIHRACARLPPDARVLPLEVQLELMVAMVREGIRAVDECARE